MKKYTHALIACKAVERLQKVDLSDQNKPFADYLLKWFMAHKNGVIRGAWYPDEVIRDMSTSHVYKYAPAIVGTQRAVSLPRSLPTTSLEFGIGQKSALYSQPSTVNPKDNLPDRCEALSHAVIDNLRIREVEGKGSPLTSTDDHIALVLFMLSHYVADAHMPMHCDCREDDFLGFNVHTDAEEAWERQVVRYFKIDRFHQCFINDDAGFPLLVPDADYANTHLKATLDELDKREFRVGYGNGNDNVREYMQAVTQYSYLTSYAWLPEGLTSAEFDREKLQTANGLPFRELSIAVLADAIDAVARVWLHDLRRFMWWKDAQPA